MTKLRFWSVAGLLLALLMGSSSFGGDVISDWDQAVPPKAPTLKDVTVDPSTTALLILDVMKANCNARPRCKVAFPSLKLMHDQARAHNMMVWYSFVGGPETSYDPSIKPRDGEWFTVNGGDKFIGSTLEPLLTEHGVKTVIICGSSFQGATLGTAAGATSRGFKVIVPVDCSSSEDVYHEQYAAFHLAPGGGPGLLTSNTTLTRTSMMKF